MKKKSAGLVVGVMAIMLAACASQNKGVETAAAATQTVEEASEEETYEGAGLTNPWVDSDQAGVREATGFNMTAPEEATNVAYSYMPSAGMAQMNFTKDNAMWVYRIQPTDALEDISGIFCEWNYTEKTKVGGMDAIEYGYSSEQKGDYIDDMEGVRVINWYDAQKKATHSLSVLGTDLNGLDIAVFAEDLFQASADAV